MEDTSLVFCFGPYLFNAFAKPVPPSDTTIWGSAIRFINALHASACSYRHKYQPSTFLSSQQIKTHVFRPIYIPSKNYTSLAASIFGGMGHIFQNFDVFLLNVLPSPGISDCDSLLNNQSKKICNSFELLSILCVNDVLHSLQNQRCDPAFVFPDLTHFFPQTGQFTWFI